MIEKREKEREIASEKALAMTSYTSEVKFLSCNFRALF
ncbi:MAG: hypothetical protein JETT_1988 [Candidatus Jettenia ecosi]|uniref:Uncharacterized protein n=1 Tax=Candidatus Jettenia ecosi TaxID=2494326 RepID=A0A533QAQ0_9BACT|nr:MAG: hypothetical protein JETT_1988 [Candidatus Jettenia ecosi]